MGLGFLLGKPSFDGASAAINAKANDLESGLGGKHCLLLFELCRPCGFVPDFRKKKSGGYSAATFIFSSVSVLMKSTAFCTSLAARKMARLSSFKADNQPSM